MTVAISVRIAESSSPTSMVVEAPAWACAAGLLVAVISLSRKAGSPRRHGRGAGLQ